MRNIYNGLLKKKVAFDMFRITLKILCFFSCADYNTMPYVRWHIMIRLPFDQPKTSNNIFVIDMILRFNRLIRSKITNLTIFTFKTEME